MKYQKSLSILTVAVALLSTVAAAIGIFSGGGDGPFTITSVRGEEVLIYGEGIYRHMTADVAPQGIAQDVITLVAGVPMLVIGLLLARRGSLGAKLLLTGTLGYFMVTYVFYLVMGMYNELFLVYVVLAGSSFYAFVLAMISFELDRLPECFGEQAPRRFVGGFLIFNAVAIALLWLGVVVPPLVEGVYPPEVAHYTTLIVQGLDLSILLPASFLSGILLIKKKPLGYLLGPTYIVFLSILMTALVGKVIGQMLVGVDVGGPVLVIIPAIALTAIIAAVLMLRSVRSPA